MKNSKMKIRLSFSGALMAVALFFTHSYLSISALVASFLHELGHIAAARLCKIPLKELRLGIFGAALTPTSAIYSYKKEILLAISGPLVNILSGIFMILFFDVGSGFLELFTEASLFLGVLNLLPITDFDGGRVLFCLISYEFSPKVAFTVLKTTSFILVLSLWIFSVYLLLRLSSTLSLFVFSVFLFSKLFIIAEKPIFFRE